MQTFLMDEWPVSPPSALWLLLDPTKEIPNFSVLIATYDHEISDFTLLNYLHVLFALLPD